MEVVLKEPVVSAVKRKESPDPVREANKECFRTAKDKLFDGSILMSRIYHDELYKEWGYSSFQDYVETEDDLKMSYRIAMYYVGIGDKIRATGITKDMLKNLSWAKLKELVPIIDNDMSIERVQELLDTARDLTFDKVRDFVMSVKTIKEVTGKSVKLVFTVTNEQSDVINEGLTTACAIMETENRNLALEGIVIEWMQIYNKSFIKELINSRVLKEHCKEKRTST